MNIELSYKTFSDGIDFESQYFALLLTFLSDTTLRKTIIHNEENCAINVVVT